MVDERLNELLRTYEAYGSLYGRKDVESMLEEEESENREKILEAVKALPSKGHG